MTHPVLVNKFEKQEDRSEYILEKMLYGIAIDETCQLISARTLYGQVKQTTGNIVYIRNYINDIINKQYEKVRDTIGKEFKGMKTFGVIIGNPPYQESTGGGRNATPIYNRFVEMGMGLTDNAIWITPSRWFSGGIGLDNFRHNMLSSNRIQSIKHYKISTNVFSDVDIAGGVSILTICKHSDSFKFIDAITDKAVELSYSDCKHNGDEIILDRCEAYTITNKINKCNTMKNNVLPLNVFNLSANFEGSLLDTDEYNIEVLGSYNRISYISQAELTKGVEFIDKYKVIVGKASSEHAGEPSKDGRYSVLSSNIQILKPYQICTFSYIVVGIFSKYEQAFNEVKYLKTKFVRFLILITLASMNMSAKNWMFVPLQDFTNNSDINWNQPISEIDKQLYKKYNITDEEIDYIEKTIKPMN